MNIKTIQREARRQGLRLYMERDPETKEIIYILQDEDGEEIETNNKKYLYGYLLAAE